MMHPSLPAFQSRFQELPRRSISRILLAALLGGWALANAAQTSTASSSPSSLASASSAAPASEPGAAQVVLEDAYVVGDLERGSAEIVAVLSRPAKQQSIGVNISYRITSPAPDDRYEAQSRFDLRQPTTETRFKITAKVVRAWSAELPFLYHLNMKISDTQGNFLIEANQKFGLRKIEARQGRLAVNNHLFFVRGCTNRESDRCRELNSEEARKRLKAILSYGFNAERHAGHCPGETYLRAADELGVFQQVELSGLAEIQDSLAASQEPYKSQEFLKIQERWETMIRAARAHPCILIYSMGEGIKRADTPFIQCLDILYDRARQLDPVPLVCARCGGEPANDALGKFDCIERRMGGREGCAEMVRPVLGAYLRGERKGISDRLPIFALDYPEHGSFPDLETRQAYDRVPSWLLGLENSARAKGVLGELPSLALNSRRLQFACIKQMIEEARKFDELEGYWLSGFLDDGVAQRGVADEFSNPKPGLEPELFKKFNGDVAILASMTRPVLWNDEELKVAFTIVNASSKKAEKAKVTWTLAAGEKTLASGESVEFPVPPWSIQGADPKSFLASFPPEPAKVTLTLKLKSDTLQAENEWTLWVYPRAFFSDSTRKILLWDPAKRLGEIAKAYSMIYREEARVPNLRRENELVIADSWTPELNEYLANGGRVLFLNEKTWGKEELGTGGAFIAKEINPDPVFPDFDDPEARTILLPLSDPNRPGSHGSAIYDHASLAGAPHAGFAGREFLHLLRRAKSFDLDSFPTQVSPIVRALDFYQRLSNKAYLCELRAGSGKLLLSSFNFSQTFASQPESRYVFDRLLRYALSRDFNPLASVSNEELQSMILVWKEKQKNNPRRSIDQTSERYGSQPKAASLPSSLPSSLPALPSAAAASSSAVPDSPAAAGGNAPSSSNP